jgi:multidrug efflux pump subunit AcrA (membrane-fusion protein)
VPYLKAEALTVPSSAVFTDDLDDDKQYVYVPGVGSSAPTKRYVKTGKKTDQKVEILDGLKEGEKVLQQKPSESPKGAAKKEG